MNKMTDDELVDDKFISNPIKPAPKMNTQRAYEFWQKSPDKKSMNTLINTLQPTIRSAITTYTGGDSPLMRAKAKTITASAIKSFSPKKDASLKSWVMLNLQGLRRYSNSLNPSVIPERIKLENYSLNEAENDFKASEGRQPTVEELADNTGISVKRINYIREMVHNPVSEGRFMEETEESPLYAPATTHTNKEMLWMDMVYDDLDPINKKIFEMRMQRGPYAGKVYSVKQMAAELGISSAAVSQRSTAIANRLAELYRYEDNI